ncbi:kinase-like domain-containing protein [Chaetomium sp. MPI-CAGE-AT-0009]|nr:kinase-like domain-containing protein [Chaetomium sp. MPI-CAGE-AT-0009]
MDTDGPMVQPASIVAEPLTYYEAAVAAIRQSDLEHPGKPLLESFVDDAIDHDLAAAFLLTRLSREGNASEPDMGAFLADWKRTIALFVRDGVCEAPDRNLVASVTRRDGGKCRITGRSGSFWDPLVVVPILPRIKLADVDVEDSPCHQMLGAFLTPKIRDLLLSDTEEESYKRVENHWLLRKSAAAAFAQGYFQLSFKRRSRYAVLKILRGGPRYPAILDKVDDFRRGSFVDASASKIKLPNPWALEVLSHFATPLRWTYIAQEIASKQCKEAYGVSSSPFPFSDTCAAILKIVLRGVPGIIRIATYCILESLGARIYGVTESSYVQKLPFGLYLKVVSSARRESLANEYATLELIRRHMNIPVPRALDLVSNSSYSYLLTTQIPGYNLGLCIDTMSDEDTTALVHDLRRHMIALRAVPRPLGWKHAISNAVDGPCFDYRLNTALNHDEARREVVGPFLTEDDFNATLRCGALPEVVHRSGHEIVFTHGELSLRNILVDEHGRLAGIVDWENAGWFPEYWDYTKAHFVTKFRQRWLGMVDGIFGQFGDYGHELGIERELWNYRF